MRTHLLLTNLPYNCSDREVKDWVESRGFRTESIRIVRDLVSGASPAFGYVELNIDEAIGEAIAALNGKKLRQQNVWVEPAR
jgi:RNA recognition motif-containing protein